MGNGTLSLNGSPHRGQAVRSPNLADMRVGNRIAEIRKARGWSQGDVARAICARFPGAKVSLPTVGAWERGDAVPTLAYALALAAVLDVRAEDLFAIAE